MQDLHVACRDPQPIDTWWRSRHLWTARSPVRPVEDLKLRFIDFRDVLPFKVVPYFIIGQTYFRIIDYLEAHRYTGAQFGKISGSSKLPNRNVSFWRFW